MPDFQLIGIRRPGGPSELLGTDSAQIPGRMIKCAKRLVFKDYYYGAVVNEFTVAGDCVAVYANARVGGPERNRLRSDELISDGMGGVR